jgi:hypothetical protein
MEVLGRETVGLEIATNIANESPFSKTNQLRFLPCPALEICFKVRTIFGKILCTIDH